MIEFIRSHLAVIILYVATIIVWFVVVKLMYDGKTKKNPNAAAQFLARHEKNVNRLLYLMLNVVLIIIVIIVSLPELYRISSA